MINDVLEAARDCAPDRVVDIRVTDGGAFQIGLRDWLPGDERHGTEGAEMADIEWRAGVVFEDAVTVEGDVAWWTFGPAAKEDTP